MKINLTPEEPYAFQIDNKSSTHYYTEPYAYDPLSDVRVPEAHYVEFDGVVRAVKDFRAYVRSAVRAAQVRHDEVLRAMDAHKKTKEELQRLRERNRDLETHLLEAHEERKLLKTALEDSRNHGRYVLVNDPQPLQDPTVKMTVFGVSYDEAYKRVRDYEELERKLKIANHKADLAENRSEERKHEITDLHEALRQKNEIIKSIREKVAEARIYE